MDKVTDVVVVGFGAAGSAAAIEAADAGAKVLILEKMRRPGGAVYMSKGLVYGAGTSVQRAAQITDSADAMYDYMMATDNMLRDPVLSRVLADKSAEAVEWLLQLGVDFPPEELAISGDEREYARISPPSPRA
ncbi:MAG: FAD-dependent oxidoreductase, partial [Dehalococcoidia bacterium]|nr:FAD-dependent oxidoreductase [Dehalococcoidia bacterium]